MLPGLSVCSCQQEALLWELLDVVSGNRFLSLRNIYPDQLLHDCESRRCVSRWSHNVHSYQGSQPDEDSDVRRRECV